ncbi:MAG: SDR family NAD(P)-dependent oxidoreductase [Hyphomicrobiaceae bacterium]
MALAASGTSSGDAGSAPAPTRPFVVVTGGSEGIGFAIAERFAAKGRCLLLVARRPDALDAAAAQLRSRHAVDVATLSLDVARPDAPHALDEALGSLGAHCDILVNSAAIGHCGSFADAGPDALDDLVALNVAAPTRLMRHVLPGMRSRRGGGIIMVCSLAALVPGPYQAAYYASKAYLLSLSEAVAAEVKGDGVRITAVVPGPVETRFHARMQAEGALYRRLFPSASPASVARWTVLGYEMAVRVVVPGLLDMIASVGLRILPHALVIPLMAMLLDPRRPIEKGAASDV